MKSSTIVKRYARALLMLGREDGKLADYGRDLMEFSQSLLGAGEEGRALFSPFFPKDTRRAMLNSVLERAALNPLSSNFIKLLMDNGRLADLPDIARAYKDMEDGLGGVVRAALSSAADIDEGQVAAIREALSAFAGKRVELCVQKDPSIIGGLIAKMGDLVIDGSVRAQINRLARALE